MEAPGQEVRTQSSSSSIPVNPSPCTGVSTDMYVCGYHSSTHRCCRSFSRRSLPRLDMMSSGTLGVERMTLEGLEGGEEGSGYLGSGGHSLG